MAENEKKETNGEMSLPFASLDSLRGKQSVRATFKLSEECIDAIAIVAAQLGIKQKSLFDHLIDDMESLRVIAGELQDTRFSNRSRVQKTYVLSRKTLYCIDEVSQSLAIPRDALVEYSVQQLLPIIDEERKKHQNRKQILKEMGQYLKQGEKILKKYKAILGEDDPVFEQTRKDIERSFPPPCLFNYDRD